MVTHLKLTKFFQEQIGNKNGTSKSKSKYLHFTKAMESVGTNPLLKNQQGISTDYTREYSKKRSF